MCGILRLRHNAGRRRAADVVIHLEFSPPFPEAEGIDLPSDLPPANDLPETETHFQLSNFVSLL
jgi:hypothetical protein